MSDVQVWTLIGVFAATMFGVIGIITTSFTKTMNAGFAGVGYRIEVVESRLDAKIDSVESRLSARIETVESRLNARIETVESRLGAKIDLLDRDISVIARRVFPDESS